ncbi:Hypothetical_protein [Hexamita inflata]|uniref:Hypothetical_protein n=1 Tax=Hexamita inflata TaxID=28002 RepID=A0AA86RA56_9EUKA|nr:Hypothetical protein HINF_LOCUS60012 [Hexamita inflata]
MTRFISLKHFISAILIIQDKLKSCGRFEEFYPHHCFVWTKSNWEPLQTELCNDGKLVLRRKWDSLKVQQVISILIAVQWLICTVNRRRYYRVDIQRCLPRETYWRNIDIIAAKQSDYHTCNEAQGIQGRLFQKSDTEIEYKLLNFVKKKDPE